LKYAVTHRDFRVSVFNGLGPLSRQKRQIFPSVRDNGGRLEWIPLERLESLLLPAIDRKVIQRCQTLGL